MRYVKNVLVNEMATIGIFVILTIIAAITACIVTGTTDYDAACNMGYIIGVISGTIMRLVMIVVFAVTIIKTSKTIS